MIASNALHILAINDASVSVHTPRSTIKKVQAGIAKSSLQAATRL